MIAVNIHTALNGLMPFVGDAYGQTIVARSHTVMLHISMFISHWTHNKCRDKSERSTVLASQTIKAIWHTDGVHISVLISHLTLCQ